MRFTLPVLLFALLLPALLHAQAAPKPELMLWVKSGDLTGFKDGDKVSSWPDASGAKRHLKTTGDACPSFKADGYNGFPTVAFAGDIRSNPKVVQYFNLPFTGEWRGVTVFAAGKGLAGGGWFDSAPGGSGCLRTCGWVQLTGTKGGGKGFTDLQGPALGVATLQAIIGDDGVLHVALYANGKLQEETKDEEPLNGIIFRNGHVGTTNTGEMAFNGELAELLIYRGSLADKDRQAVERYLLAKYGLAAASPDDPKAPAGYTPPPDPGKNPPPPVKRTPFVEDLQLWMRADDIKGLPDGSPLDKVPNLMGDKPLTSEGANRPKLNIGAMNGRSTVKFEGSYDPRVVQWLNIPLQGETPEMTLIVAGRGLTRAGVFDSAPGGNGCLRTMGWLQLTGSKLAPGTPFPLLKDPNEPQMIAITVGKLGETGQYLATYANTWLQQRAEAPDTRQPVILRNPYLGTNNVGETQFTGEIAEVLLYDRALTDAERQQSELYLAEKWGIAVKSKAQIEREMAARSRWSARMTQLPRTMSWIGNTFSGKDSHNGVHVQSGISGMTVLPDGTVAATSVWDEPHKEIGLYKDGQPVKGISGGCSGIAYDENYFYVGNSGMGKTVAGIRRHNREDLKPAPWPDMKAWPQFDTPRIWCEVRGIVVLGNELYVTAGGVNEVKVFDKASGTLLRAFPVESPGSLAVDQGGKLWVGVKDGAAQYNPDGTPTGKRVAGVSAGALAVDGKGRLLVADNGERQQVIFFDISGAQPKETGTLGERGGIYATPRPGALSPARLANLNGVGADAAGNIYTNGNGIMRGYAPDGTLRWELQCTEFCTCGDFDPATDGIDLYTPNFHYRAIAGAVPGKDWVLTGVSTDGRKYPEIASSGAQNVYIRRLNGQLFRFAIGGTLQIHRLDKESEIFVPCGQYASREYKNYPRLQAAPAKGRYFWIDRNGNGLAEDGEFNLPAEKAPPTQDNYATFVDEKGGIWEPQDRYGVRYVPLQGISPQGVPIYDLAKEQWFKRPAEFSEILRAYYYPATDTMYLAGYTWDHPSLGSEHWGNCGREVIRYDDWTKPARKLRSRMPYPDGAANIKAIDFAPGANLLFAGEMETSVIFVYNTATGKLLGIVEPDQELVGMVGWIDTDAAVRVFTRKNGEHILVVEDSWAQKQMIYRLPALK